MMSETRNELRSRLVDEVMVSCPKTLPSTATVARARHVLADEHVHMALLLDGIRLVGTLTRPDIAESRVSDQGIALSIAVLDGRIVNPHDTAECALNAMIQRGFRRLAVVTETGELVGLLCLKRSRTGFCSDADVAARAADREP